MNDEQSHFRVQELSTPRVTTGKIKTAWRLLINGRGIIGHTN